VLIVLAASLGLLVLVLTYPKNRSEVSGYAVGLTLVLVSLGASASAPEVLRYGSLGLTALILLVSTLIASRNQHPSRKMGWIYAWMTWAVMVSVYLRSSSLATIALTLVVPALLVLVLSRFTYSDIKPFMRWIGALVILQALIAFAEIMLLSEPIWGYRNVYTNGQPVIRYNPFIPGLIRVQGTMGHPIPYALLMTVALLLLLGLGHHLSKRYKTVCVMAALSGILLSGTRSAFIAAAVGLLVFLLLAPSTRSRRRNFILVTLSVVGLAVGDFGLSAITRDAATSDSFSHRVEGLLNVAGLLRQPQGQVLAGSGLNSEGKLFARGLLQQDGFFVIDNHYIWTIAVTGIIGLVLMVAATVAAWHRRDRLGRAMIATFVVMGFSFDLMTWSASAALFVVALALPTGAGHSKLPATLSPAEVDVDHPSGIQDPTLQRAPTYKP
jgi:hypothetical protein